MISEEKTLFKEKAKRFWENNSEKIIQVGLGVIVIGTVAGVAYSNNRSVGKKIGNINSRLNESTPEPDIKYLGRNGLVLNGANRMPPEEIPFEFISNGASLQHMGEFGEDVAALLEIPIESKMSSIHFVNEE